MDSKRRNQLIAAAVVILVVVIGWWWLSAATDPATITDIEIEEPIVTDPDTPVTQ